MMLSTALQVTERHRPLAVAVNGQLARLRAGRSTILRLEREKITTPRPLSKIPGTTADLDQHVWRAGGALATIILAMRAPCRTW